MTSPRNSRRTANRVRVSLTGALGGDIDGAWWPYTASMGRELPDLVDALIPAIGAVVDIQINWLAKSRTPVLSTMAAAAATKMGWDSSQQRLMSLAGTTASTRILVIPTMTPVALALMVLRQSAGRAIPDIEYGTPVYEAADRIVRAAKVASGSWKVAPATGTGLGPD